MAYDIGPKIGIEGEAAFRQAINDINTNMRTLGTEMQAVTSKFDKNDKSMEAITAKNDVLNRQIDLQVSKLSELSRGLEAAREKYGENDKVTQGWQQAVNKATADLNIMQRELASNANALEEQGNELEDNTEKTNKFTGALGGLGKGLANIGKVTAKAAIAGIAAVGTAATAAAAGAFKLASDAGKTADDLITLSNKTGISTKQLQEMSYASRFVDVELETMTGSMVKLTKSMDNARNGSKDSAEAFKKLGVEYRDSVTGELRDSQTIWTEAIAALGKMPNETERNATAMKLFGKSAAELNPLIVAGADELKRLGEEANNVGAVLSDEALASAGKFDDMMQTLEASSKGMAATLGVAVIPAVSELVNTVVGVVPKITEAIKTGDWASAGQALTDGINGLVSKITDALPGLAMMGQTIIAGLATTIITAVPDILPPLIQAAVMLLNTLVQTLSDNGPMLVQAAIVALTTLINGIVDALPMLIDAAIKMIEALVNGLTDNLPKLIDAAIKIVFALTDGILKLLPKLIPAALKLIVTLAQGLIDALPKLIEKLPQIVETIVNVIVENLPLIIDAAIQIIVALTVALIQNLPLLIEAAIKIIGALVKGMINAIYRINEVPLKLFSELKTSLSKLDWGELGKNMIWGIVNGIKSAAKNIANSVVDAAKGALNSAKDFLGIHSPSRVMRDQIGMMIGAGMAEGISKSAKAVNSAMQGLNDQLVTDEKANLNIGTTTKSSNQDANTALESDSAEATIVTPIYLGDKIIAEAVSRVQYKNGRIRARMTGMRVSV